MRRWEIRAVDRWRRKINGIKRRRNRRCKGE
jgi:hypothetical protein